MADYTRLTNLEVIGELKADGMRIAAAAEMSAVAKAASTSYTTAEIDAIVDAVNALTAALGRPAT